MRGSSCEQKRGPFGAVASFVTTKHIVCTTCNVNGIDEAVFTEGISEVPEGFLVASGDVVELVVNASNGTAFDLTMQEG